MRSSAKIDDILCCADLPTLSLAYSKIDKLIGQGSESETSIASILGEESSEIKETLLKLANSKLFDFIAPVTSVGDAVRLIGQEQVRDLVLAISMTRMLAEESPDIVTRQTFWNHSIACGVGARMLAKFLNVDNIERYFLAGLLHDMGSLLVYAHISEESLMKILRERDISTTL